MPPLRHHHPPSFPGPERAFRKLPPGVWALGFVSMFMDTSSECIHSLLPVFMANVLGASMAAIGIVEGMGEAAAAVTKVFSGALSDRLGKRKLLAGAGYGLAAAVKPIFPLAATIGWVFVARFLDRIGKGIRGAPRDALVADLTPRAQRGAAYGLRQSLDSVGAFIGPLLAVVFMAILADNIRAVLWVAVLPGILAVALLILCVHDPARPAARTAAAHHPLTRAEARQLPKRYWIIVALGAVFSLARFSEAFLVLRAPDAGVSLGYVPLVLIVMNIAYTATAYPAGVVSDRFGPRPLLIVGLGMLVAADGILARAASPLTLFLGAACWGLHMGLTQGLLAQLIAGAVPHSSRGTAFGIFNLVAGGSLLVSSVVAGALWGRFGAPVTFMTGAFFAFMAMLGLIVHRYAFRHTP